MFRFSNCSYLSQQAGGGQSNGQATAASEQTWVTCAATTRLFNVLKLAIKLPAGFRRKLQCCWTLVWCLVNKLSCRIRRVHVCKFDKEETLAGELVRGVDKRLLCCAVAAVSARCDLWQTAGPTGWQGGTASTSLRYTSGDLRCL